MSNDMQRDTAIESLVCYYRRVEDTVHLRSVFHFLLVLRAKNEKGAGFRQGNSFFLQLQISHRPGTRADGNFRFYLLIITYEPKEDKSVQRGSFKCSGHFMPLQKKNKFVLVIVI